MELKLLLICGLIPSILCQCTLETAKSEFRRSVYDFSIDLLLRIAQEKEYHFVASTLSPWTLLTAVSLGAEDDTLSELKQVLNLHEQKCFNNKYLKLASSISSNSDPEVFVERSSVLFADESLSVKSWFKNRLTRTGVSEIQVISLQDGDAAAAIINDYVSRATHETIEEVVSPSDLDGLVALMLDALFFKGTWRTPFLASETEIGPFYNNNGDQIGDVNLMFVNGYFNMNAIKQLDATVLELPYGQTGKYSALMLLPFKGVPLYEVISKLKLNSLATIFKQFTGEVNVLVEIPRFKISSDMSNMIELLEDMGLKEMFDSSRASFPKISDEPLYVSQFFQKASIEVTEEGTTASAVSGAGFESRSLPPKFTANRPFLFIIVDKENEVPLFAGAYSKPSEY